MSYTLIAASLIAAVTLAAFVSLVRARWFARMERGFLVALMLAVGGVSFVAASLLGLWAYERGRRVLLQTMRDGTSNLADVIQAEMLDDLSEAHERLGRLADDVVAERSSADEATLREILQEVQRFDPRFLQITLLDKNGNLHVSSSLADGEEPVDRIAVAFNLEGRRFTSDPFFSSVFHRYVLYTGVPLKDSSGVVGALTARYDMQSELTPLLEAARFGKSGYTVLVDGDGRILAHPSSSRVREDISNYAAVKEARQGKTGWVRETNPAGIERLFFYRPLPPLATVGSKPWIMMTEIDAEEAHAPLHALGVEFAVGLVVLLVACLVLSRQVALTIRRPVHELVEFAHGVRDGDLERRIAIEGRDEMGQLAGALNDMVAALQERDRIKEVFGRYVTTQVSEKILEGKINLGGERRNLTMLFSDIRNFTTMSESLRPEEVVGLLNDYFSEMVDAVFEHSGILDKFIGDGLLALFGALEEPPDHARRAVLTALRMKALLGKINGEREAAGKPPIAIGIGVHTDDVVVGNIGSRRRLEYTVVGDGVNTCSRVESLNKQFGTTILITESTYAALGDEFVFREMPEAQLKGKKRAPKVFEVVSTKTPATRAIDS